MSEYQQVYFNQQSEALGEDAIADAGNSVLIAGADYTRAM